MRLLLVLLLLAACVAPEPEPETVGEAFDREAAALKAEAEPEQKGLFDFLRPKKKPSVLDGTSIIVITEGAGPGEEPEENP